MTRTLLAFLLMVLATQGKVLAESATDKAAHHQTVLSQTALDQALSQRTTEINLQNTQWQARQQQRQIALFADQSLLEEKLTQAKQQLTAINLDIDSTEARLIRLTEAQALHAKDKEQLEASVLEINSLLKGLSANADVSAILADSSDVTLSLETLEQSVLTGLDHIDNSSRVTSLKQSVFMPDGNSVELEVLAIGGEARIAFSPTLGWGWVLADKGIYTWFGAGQNANILAKFAEEASNMLPIDIASSTLASKAGEQTIGDWFRQGGLLLWPLVVLFTVAIACVIWRSAVLFSFKTTKAPDFDQPDLSRAELLKHYESQTTTLAKSISALLSKRQPVDAVEHTLQAIYLTHSQPLVRGLGLIALLAALAPMLGLLGTVTGMMTTFQQLTWFGNANPQLLSEGISVALITTQAGLIVALPLLLLHYPLKRKAQAICIGIETQLVSLAACLNQERLNPSILNPRAQNQQYEKSSNKSKLNTQQELCASTLAKEGKAS